MLLLGLSASVAVAVETVYVPAEKTGWQIAYRSSVGGVTLIELIPTDENLSSWSRMFTIQFMEGMRESPARFMEKLRARMLTRCPSTQWTVLAEDALSITYEWSISRCAAAPDQHELARLLKGNDGVHRIGYVRKVSELEATERATWLNTFASSYVEMDGKRVVVAP